MKPFLAEVRAALLVTLAFAVVCCGLYPFIVFGIGQLVFHKRANGSLIMDRHGRALGSQLLGQVFTNALYFHSRPSATGRGYEAPASGGSNLGPTSQALHDIIRQRIAAYRLENKLGDTVPLPADAVTASGSGLDPHISPASARLQVARVAAARRLAPTTVAGLVEQAVESPQLRFLGAARVNVLRLNLALDRLNSSP